MLMLQLLSATAVPFRLCSSMYSASGRPTVGVGSAIISLITTSYLLIFCPLQCVVQIVVVNNSMMIYFTLFIILLLLFIAQK